MLFVATVTPVFSSIIFISEDLDTTITSLSPLAPVVSTTLSSSISSLPSPLALISFSSAMLAAVPPTWKVLSVNCVPGSPIDCAAITPTASPV